MGVAKCALRLLGALKRYRVSAISEIRIYDPIYAVAQVGDSDHRSTAIRTETEPRKYLFTRISPACIVARRDSQVVGDKQ